MAKSEKRRRRGIGAYMASMAAAAWRNGGVAGGSVAATRNIIGAWRTRRGINKQRDIGIAEKISSWQA